MNALIVGKRRMGKSTLALALGRMHSNIIIVYDPNTQYRDFGPARSIAEIDAAMAHFSDEANELPPEPVVMVFRPRTESIDEDFSALAEMLWKWDGFSFVVDEAPTLQTPHNINDRLARLLRQGPAGVSVFQTCHRVVDVNRLARALCTDYFFFRSTQQKDVGNMAAEFDDRLARILPSLRAFELVHHWQGVGGVDEISIWRNPKPWFVELGHGEHEYTREAGDDEPEPGKGYRPLIDTTRPPEQDEVYRGLGGSE